MDNNEMRFSNEKPTEKQRVDLDTKLEKGKLVGFDLGEIQQRVARMKELEEKVLPEHSKRIIALKRELETMQKEYDSLKEDVDMGVAKFADLQRFEGMASKLLTKQAELATAQDVRAESRRELANLDPELYSDLYKLERSQAESAK